VIEINEDVVQACIRNDSDAYSRIFYETKEIVHGLVFKLLGPDHEVDDVVQNSFVELFRTLHLFQGKCKFSTWVYRVVYNVCLQHFRAKQRSRRHFLIDGKIDPDDCSSDGFNSDPKMLEEKQKREIIHRAILSLPMKFRAVVVLHDVEEKGLEQTAEILKKPVGTVKSRLFFARRELRKKLENSGAL
jgi:RNA polymerase sigma-70 factor, ECF subfamily